MLQLVYSARIRKSWDHQQSAPSNMLLLVMSSCKLSYVQRTWYSWHTQGHDVLCLWHRASSCISDKTKYVSFKLDSVVNSVDYKSYKKYCSNAYHVLRIMIENITWRLYYYIKKKKKKNCKQQIMPRKH
jgi:hypothetical protein